MEFRNMEFSPSSFFTDYCLNCFIRSLLSEALCELKIHTCATYFSTLLEFELIYGPSNENVIADCERKGWQLISDRPGVNEENHDKIQAR